MTVTESAINASNGHDKIPGTVLLVDLNHVSDSAHLGNGEIVLLPAPSSDPEDPLNWTPRRKLLSTICMSTYVMFVGMSNSVVYSVLVPVSEATGLTVADLNSGTGYAFLLAGWGLLFWQPFALQYGKRPTFLISTAATLVC
jgi:hypothetical protein